MALCFHVARTIPEEGETAIAPIRSLTLGPDSGAAVMVSPGQRLRVTDRRGLQVVDMAVFARANPREKLSTSYSRSRFDPATVGKFYPRDRLTAGDYLMSTINREMMRILADTQSAKGMHDAHGRMCNRRLFRVLGRGERDGCHEIIARAMAPHGILPEDVPDTFDLFMNFHHDCARGHWVIEPGVSKAGDYVEFEAVMDCIVALSNCPFYDGQEIGVDIFAAA
jgi:uncharacterized protein YcgI (DUF1989 family)